MNKLIGFQLVEFNKKTKKYDNIPDGLFSFIVFKQYYNAVLYLNDYGDKSAKYKIIKIYDGDIEEPTFYEDLKKETSQDRIDNIKRFLVQKNPNISINYMNEKEGSIFFNGLVRIPFLEELKKELKLSDIGITHLPTAIAKKGVCIFFVF